MKPSLTFNFQIKTFSGFLKHRSNISFFASPIGKTEIKNAISSLDSNKSVESNSIL